MNNNNHTRPEDMENVFKREKFEVIMPFRANNNIWNQERYNFESINTEEGKLIIITEKKEKESASDKKEL
jgi:hypothetical protein